MSKEMLKYLRLVIPGVLVYLAFLPLVTGSLSFIHLVNFDVKAALYFLSVIVIGALYRTFKVRDFVFKEPIVEIQTNIRDRLAAPFLDEDFGKKVKAMEPRRLMKVFYHFVDRDPSLREKTKDVYENGLLLSTYADVVVVSFFAAMAYGSAYFFKREVEYIWAATFFIVMFAAGNLLLPVAKRRHRELGDEQLEVITFSYAAELREKLAQLAGEDR